MCNFQREQTMLQWQNSSLHKHSSYKGGLIPTPIHDSRGINYPESQFTVNKNAQSQFTVNKNGLSQVTGQPIHNSQLINKAIHGSQE